MKITRGEFWALIQARAGVGEDWSEIIFVVCMYGLADIKEKSLKEILEHPEEPVDFEGAEDELIALINSIEGDCDTSDLGDTMPGKCYIKSPFGYMEIDDELPYIVREGFSSRPLGKFLPPRYAIYAGHHLYKFLQWGTDLGIWYHYSEDPAEESEEPGNRVYPLSETDYDLILKEFGLESLRGKLSPELIRTIDPETLRAMSQVVKGKKLDKNSTVIVGLQKKIDALERLRNFLCPQDLSEVISTRTP